MGSGCWSKELTKREAGSESCCGCWRRQLEAKERARGVIFPTERSWEGLLQWWLWRRGYYSRRGDKEEVGRWLQEKKKRSRGLFGSAGGREESEAADRENKEEASWPWEKGERELAAEEGGWKREWGGRVAVAPKVWLATGRTRRRLAGHGRRERGS